MSIMTGKQVFDIVSIAKKINFDVPTQLRGPTYYSNFEEILKNFPPGWTSVFNEFLYAYLSLMRIDKNRINNIKYVNGILRFTTEVSVGPVRWLCDGFTKSISMRCMISPDTRGRRRTAYEGSPCLSAQNYILYANEEAERRLNGTASN